MLLNLFMRVPPFRFDFLVAKKPLPDRVHPFQLRKPILDRCDVSLFFNTAYLVKPNLDIIVVLLLTIFTSFLVFFLIEKLFPIAGLKPQCAQKANPIDFQLLFRIHMLIFALWSGGYLLNVAASGGIPIWWRISGNEKTYVDFGLPTFTGLLNAVRLFLVTSLILLGHEKHPTVARWYLLPLGIILISPIVELNRGGFIQTMSFAAFAFLSIRPFTFRTLSFILTATFLILGITSIIGYFRYSANETASIAHFLPPYPDSVFFFLPQQVFWMFAYVTSPLNNLFYLADVTVPRLQLLHTVYPLVPTVVRDTLFPGKDFMPIALPRVEFTAVTQFGPVFQDFGILGIMLFAVLVQTISSIVYIRARGGDFLSKHIYIGLLSCLSLGFFYNYYLSLVTVAYFAISWFVCSIVIRKKAESYF